MAKSRLDIALESLELMKGTCPYGEMTQEEFEQSHPEDAARMAECVEIFVASMQQIIPQNPLAKSEGD